MLVPRPVHNPLVYCFNPQHQTIVRKSSHNGVLDIVLDNPETRGDGSVGIVYVGIGKR
jgi:hypothetical protein